MKDEYEEGWDALGDRLSGYEPEAVDVRANFAAYQALKATEAATAAGPLAGIAAKLGISLQGLAYLAGLIGLVLLGGVVAFNQLSPANDGPALESTNSNGPDAVINTAAGSDAAPGASEPYPTDEKEANGGQPTAVGSDDRPTSARRTAPLSRGTVPTIPDPASASKPSATGPGSVVSPTSPREPGAENTTTKESSGGDGAIAVSESLSGQQENLQRGAPPTGNTEPRTEAASEAATATSQLPFPPTGLGAGEPLFERAERITAPTSVAPTSVAGPGKVSAVEHTTWSVAIGRQFTVGRNSGNALGEGALHGYVEVHNPIGERFGWAVRMGFSSYGTSQDQEREAIDRNVVELLTPLGEKLAFHQVAYADGAGSLDLIALGTYRFAPRLQAHAGLRYSPTLYTVSQDDGGIPLNMNTLDDVLGISWREFGATMGGTFRVWENINLEASYAPSFTNPLRGHNDGQIGTGGPTFTVGKLKTSSGKVALKVQF